MRDNVREVRKQYLERWRFGKPEQSCTGQTNVRSENTLMEREKEQVMDIQGVQQKRFCKT